MTPTPTAPTSPDAARVTPAAAWPGYAWSLAVVALTTGAAWLLAPHVAAANLAMLYLLGVIVVATRLGRGPAVVASIASVAVFDFFFVPPPLSFAVADTEYLIT